MNYQVKRKRYSLFYSQIMILMVMILTCYQTIYSQIKSDSNNSELIKQTLSGFVNDGKAPGMIAAIISSEGVIAIGSAGVRKAGADIAFTTNDHVHLGSCTKAMTSTMLATLVGEGKLSWNMKLVEAIPELKKSIHPDHQKITLWQLLTHRAGIAKNPVSWAAFKDQEIKERRLSILTDGLKYPSGLKPGVFHYSNFGYMIAGCMAERVTGQSWEMLMINRLFDPLGMSSAGFGAPGTAEKIDQPWGHEKLGKGWNPSYPDNPEALGPAGRVHCSVEDWGKFISLQLPGKKTILDSRSLNELVLPVGFYAAGWGIVEQPWAQGKVFTHNGSNGIWYAMVMVAPKLDRAFVVATNSCDFSNTNEICTKVIRELIRMELHSNNG